MSGYDVKYIQEYLHLSCPQSIYRWFKGRALPSAEHLCALSKLLNVHMENLLVLEGESLILSMIEFVNNPTTKRLLFRKSRDNLENDFCNGAGLQISHEGIVVKLLEKLMGDSCGNISYFIYELDYGKEYKEGCILDNKDFIDISSAEKLYDFLMIEYGRKSDNSRMKK